VLCEIVNRADGSMQRTPQLLEFSKQHGLRCITIADLVRYRLRHEQLLERVASAPLQTRHGQFVAHVFRSAVDGSEHAALVAGGGAGGGLGLGGGAVLTAVHAQSSLVDVFGSLHCGGEGFLDQSLSAIAAEGAGVLLYVKPQGGGAAGGGGGGMAAELEAYAAGQASCDAAGGAAAAAAAGAGWALADLRDDAVAAQMLRHLGVGSVRLRAGGEAGAQRLRAFGLDVSPAGAPASNGAANGAGVHMGRGVGLRSPAAV
jgi:3,4-dihydroxy 2-butanone 4-phosphate synthase / GTP cyclohydrolase II